MGPQNLLIRHLLGKSGHITTEDDTSNNFGRPFWRYSLFCNTLKKYLLRLFWEPESQTQSWKEPQVPDRCPRASTIMYFLISLSWQAWIRSFPFVVLVQYLTFSRKVTLCLPLPLFPFTFPVSDRFSILSLLITCPEASFSFFWLSAIVRTLSWRLSIFAHLIFRQSTKTSAFFFEDSQPKKS